MHVFICTLLVGAGIQHLIPVYTEGGGALWPFSRAHVLPA